MLSKDRYVEVAFPMHFNQTFTYRWSSESLNDPIGYRVLVPFQRRLLTGYVLEHTQTEQQNPIKDIQDILDETPVLTPELIDLIHFIRDKYGASLGEALQTVIPSGLLRQSKKILKPISREGFPMFHEEKELLETIRAKKKIDWNAWKKKNPASEKIVNRLVKDGWVEFQTILQKERAGTKKKTEKEITNVIQTPFELRPDQQNAVSNIDQAVKEKKHQTILLHGVTGSGKTEVYLQTAQHCLDTGRNVLALVPEISLTPMFLDRFKNRFGDKIALLHSQRTETENVADWRRILDGKARVVVGTRSAVFAPLKNIGLIILDEEHDRSYKQEEQVMYHTKDIAQLRAAHEQSVILFGSATPCVETFHQAEEKKIHKHVLSGRIQGQEMPAVEIVDLQKEKEQFGEKTIFSQRLKDEIEVTLNNHEQVILFLNRRGYSTHVYCPSCGSSLECPNCSITMTYHKEDDVFQCHYCDNHLVSNSPCKKCNATQWVRFGYGTERVEKELAYLFPDARVDRLDRDTARKKNAFETVFSNFEKRKTDILIGTQMITKGLDFEHVQLVGVLLADQSLQFPDFRSSEHTFQLLTQVIGRSGRGKKRGKAILQTLQPGHYAIVAAAQQNYDDFYQREIKYRKQTLYPPFARVVLFEMKGREEENVIQMGHWLKKQIEMQHKNDPSLMVLGPSPAPIEKINGFYRYHLFLKSTKSEELEKVTKWIFTQSRPEFQKRDLRVRYNIDPFDFM
jgi:primosomal protein N' (replication factor Y)